MISTAPLFILSCERSGSTLLRYILDSHPDICCPGELYLGQLVKDLHITVSRTLGLVYGNSPQERDQSTQQEVNRLLTELLQKFSKERGKKIWCDKTPANLKHLMELEWAFPDARYICLYRQSLDVVQSCLEVKQKGFMYDWTVPYVAKHLRNYVAAMLESWVEKTQATLTFETHHPRTCRIKYESLVTDPVAALNPVFQFLGLEWDPSLLTEVFTLKHDMGGGDYKIEATDRIEKDRIGKGALLDPELLSQIPPDLKQKQMALHQQLGYPH